MYVHYYCVGCSWRRGWESDRVNGNVYDAAMESRVRGVKGGPVNKVNKRKKIQPEFHMQRPLLGWIVISVLHEWPAIFVSLLPTLDTPFIIIVIIIIIIYYSHILIKGRVLPCMHHKRGRWSRVRQVINYQISNLLTRKKGACHPDLQFPFK